MNAFHGQVVVATSDRRLDDPIARLCDQQGWPVFRGDAFDVSHRVLSCARSFGADWFLRVNGDSPLVDRPLMEQACRLLGQELDFVTNLRPRSFPYGVAVEAVRVSAFERAYAHMTEAEDFEHVTRYLYRNIQQFDYRNLLYPGPDLSDWVLTVDTPEDLERFRLIAAGAPRRLKEVTFRDLLDISCQRRNAA